MRATMVQMKPGDVITIPMKVRCWNSIRNCASTLGVSYPGRKYSVAINREADNCKVTRVA